MEKCWICGKEGTKNFSIAEVVCLGEDEKIRSSAWAKNDNFQRCYCNECYDAVMKEHEADRKEYVRLKKKLMFERAIRMLERQGVNIYNYQRVIRKIEKYIQNNPNKFDSADEMVATIILMENEIPCIPQQKISKYTVDLCLPTMKTILEIDGERHQNRKHHDNRRDAEIKMAMGCDWEIVRIDTKYIEEKAEMLVEAIWAILDSRRKIV